jgi:hypothetical protein
MYIYIFVHFVSDDCNISSGNGFVKHFLTF